MSVVLQQSRGNTAAVAAYTGPAGELIVNTDTWQLSVQDGTTPGGHVITPLAIPVTVPNGGTGGTTFLAHGVLLGEGTSAFGTAAVGTAGRLLIDQGGSADPAFEVMSGDATIGSTGVLTLGTNVVSNAKFRQSTGLSVVGRSASTTGNVADITGTANQILSVDTAGTSLGFVTVSSDVTNAGGAFTIANNAVTNAKLADMATQTFKGRTTAGTGDPEDLTATQATAILNAFVGDSGSGGTKGEVPAPAAGDGAAAKYLRANGTWSQVPPYIRNRLRNSSLTQWHHGTSITVGTAGAWGPEGVYIIPTGASVTASRVAAQAFTPGQEYWARVTGAASVTGLVMRFPIEGADASVLSNQVSTFQMQVRNLTGVTVSPTITIKHAGALNDWSSPVTDVSAVALQTIAASTIGTLGYVFTASQNSGNGLSVSIDFGNVLGSSTVSLTVGSFDLRPTPAATVGTNATPNFPEIALSSEDEVWCKRFYETSYDNGTAPGTVTDSSALSMKLTAGASTVTAGKELRYSVQKYAAPTVTFYSPTTGTSGKVRDVANGGDVNVTQSLSGTKGVTWEATPSAGAVVNFKTHFEADAQIVGA